MLYPYKQKLREPLNDSHRLVRVSIGPDKLGFPTKRTRSLTAGLARNSLIWVGPESDRDVQSHFESIFCCSVEVSGDVFFLENASVMSARMTDKLRKKGKYKVALGVGLGSEFASRCWRSLGRVHGLEV